MFQNDEKDAYKVMYTVNAIIILIAGCMIFFFGFMSQIKYKWQRSYYYLARDFYRNRGMHSYIEPNMTKDQVLEYITKNIYYKKICSKDSVNEGCWSRKTYFADGTLSFDDRPYAGFILPNDVLVSNINKSTSSCDSTHLCNIISIDVNGPSFPNRYGIDIFRIYYYSDKMLPYDPRDEIKAGKAGRNFFDFKLKKLF